MPERRAQLKTVAPATTAELEETVPPRPIGPPPAPQPPPPPPAPPRVLLVSKTAVRALGAIPPKPDRPLPIPDEERTVEPEVKEEGPRGATLAEAVAGIAAEVQGEPLTGTRGPTLAEVEKDEEMPPQGEGQKDERKNKKNPR